MTWSTSVNFICTFICSIRSVWWYEKKRSEHEERRWIIRWRKSTHNQPKRIQIIWNGREETLLAALSARVSERFSLSLSFFFTSIEMYSDQCAAWVALIVSWYYISGCSCVNMWPWCEFEHCSRLSSHTHTHSHRIFEAHICFFRRTVCFGFVVICSLKILFNI